VALHDSDSATVSRDSDLALADNGSQPAADESSQSPRLNRRYVTAALMLVMALAAMEMTVTSTAMPTIIGSLHGLEHYSWVTSVYLLVCTISMPIYGRLADALGRKRVLLSAIGLFAIASVLAASAQSMTQLIVFRGLQGLGAGGIMPVVLTILGDIFTLTERAAIQGWFSAVWGTAALAGPYIGALLVENIGWRSIFFVNLPFGALGIAVLAAKYHDHEKPHSTVLDLPGVIALGMACTALLGLVSAMPPDHWNWGIAGLLLAAAVVATVAFIRIERRSVNPILPPDLVMRRTIGPPLVGSALMGVAFFGVETFVPLYVQGTTGASATAAAGVITPLMLSWAVSGIFVAPIIVRFGFRHTAVTGACLTTLSFLGLLACAIGKASGWYLAATLLVCGVGFGSTSMSYLLSVQHGVAWQQRGIATSAIQFFRTMAGAVGIGLLGMLFNILAAPQMQQLRAIGVNPGSVMDPHAAKAASPEVLSIVRAMIDSGLTWVFAAMALLAACQIAVALWMEESHEAIAVEMREPIEALP
jgi:MFS family permease